MNNENFYKKYFLGLIILLPFLLLAIWWTSLPDVVPIHWNLEGKADSFGSKYYLILIPLILPLFTFILFRIIPKIDPKKRLGEMGQKYHKLEFFLTSFMSILACLLLYTIKSGVPLQSQVLFAGIGVLYIGLGNYFQTIRPNYFVGIRTPWTLENEKNWSMTHKMAGKLWILGGLLVIPFCLVLSYQPAFVVFVVISTIIVVYPIVYSFWNREVT